MRRFIKKYYIQLITVTALGCFVIFTIGEAYKIFTMIKVQSERLKQTQMDHVLAEEYLQNIYVFKKDAAYIHENSENFNILLPNNDDEKVRLFSMIESIAQETGNKSVALSVKKSEEKTGETKKSIVPQTGDYIGITISLVGNYNDLIMFLQKVENMRYISDVISIKSIKTVDNSRDIVPVVSIADEENSEKIEVRKDLLKSDIAIVFYLDQVNK
jgi:Tfp pilus assembly protein PilO